MLRVSLIVKMAHSSYIITNYPYSKTYDDSCHVLMVAGEARQHPRYGLKENEQVVLATSLILPTQMMRGAVQHGPMINGFT